MYTIDKSDVVFENGKRIHFNGIEIKYPTEINGYLIFIAWGSGDYNNNVFGIDLSNQSVAWQIKNPKKFTKEMRETGERIMQHLQDPTLAKYYTELRCPFTDIYFGKNDNILYIRNLCNFAVTVNEKTGEVLQFVQLNDFK